MTRAHTGVQACRECREPVPADHDFCPNGHFAFWSVFDTWPEGDSEPVPAPAVPAAAPPSRPDVAVALDVSLAGAPARPVAGGVTVAARAGVTVKLVATLRNEGTLVDDYVVQLVGLPADWGPVEVGEAHLLPKDRQRDFQARVPFELLPPLAPQTTAKAWAFTVQVTSVAAGGAVIASRDCTIEVLPFSAVVIAARPAVATGRRAVTFVCEVRNNSNHAIVPALSAADADGACTIRLPASIEPIAPGATLGYRIGVRAPHRLLIGRPVDHRVTIGVLVSGLEVPPPPQLVTFRQRPFLPWWLIPLLTLLLAVAAFVYTQWPRKVTTPSLKGAKSAFVAQGLLQQAGFRKPPVVHTRVLARPAAGTIYDQRPRPGKRVDADTVVTIRVAVPPTVTIIPDLRGFTAARAEAVLFRDHLALGNVVPSPKSNNPIAGQIPRAGSVKPRNTVVNVVLADSPPLPIPNVLCKTAGSAEQQLNAAGFELAVVPTYVSPAAHARGQIPLAGARRKPGALVTLQFSGAPPTCPGGRKLGSAARGKAAGGGAASPAPSPAAASAARRARIAYSRDGVVQVTGLAGVRPRGGQPAWSPGGTQLAVRARDEIVVTRPPRPNAVATIAIAGRSLAVPALTAAHGTTVLAFVATNPDAGAQLCFARINALRPTPSCQDIGEVQPLALAWSPDGRRLLLAASTGSDPFGPGLLRFSNSSPASVDAASWRPLQTAGEDALHPVRRATSATVLDAAFLPGGRRIALITDLRPNGRLGGPQVVLVDPARIGNLGGARWLRVPGCSLDAARDGSGLAVSAPSAAGSCDGTGALMLVPIDDPRGRISLAARASDPAWRP